MDLVTVIAACAIGLRSELFVPLGMYGNCARAAEIGAEPIRDPYSAAIERWANEIAAASLRFGVSERILRAVMRAESGGVPSVTSSAGAMGLMQLMPETWATMRDRYRLGSYPYAPADNIMAGAAFLRELIDRYGAPDFLAAYNAGPARLDDHRLRGRALPNETRRYVEQLAPVVRALPASAPFPAPAAPTNNSPLQYVASSNSVPGNNVVPMGEIDANLFAMDENAGSQRRVLIDARPSRNALANPMPSARPNARDGGAIFAPIGASMAAALTSAATFRKE